MKRREAAAQVAEVQNTTTRRERASRRLTAGTVRTITRQRTPEHSVALQRTPDA